MNNTFDSHPPLSRRLALSEVPPEGLDVDIRATPLECAALAQHNALPAVHSLQAELRARQRRGDGLEIEGELRASIRQTCVTTLEEFELGAHRTHPDALCAAAGRGAAQPKATRRVD